MEYIYEEDRFGMPMDFDDEEDDIDIPEPEETPTEEPSDDELIADLMSELGLEKKSVTNEQAAMVVTFQEFWAREDVPPSMKLDVLVSIVRGPFFLIMSFAVAATSGSSRHVASIITDPQAMAFGPMKNALMGLLGRADEEEFSGGGGGEEGGSEVEQTLTALITRLITSIPTDEGRQKLLATVEHVRFSEEVVDNLLNAWVEEFEKLRGTERYPSAVLAAIGPIEVGEALLRKAHESDAIARDIVEALSRWVNAPPTETGGFGLTVANDSDIAERLAFFVENWRRERGSTLESIDYTDEHMLLEYINKQVPRMKGPSRKRLANADPLYIMEAYWTLFWQKITAPALKLVFLSKAFELNAMGQVFRFCLGDRDVASLITLKFEQENHLRKALLDMMEQGLGPTIVPNILADISIMASLSKDPKTLIDNWLHIVWGIMRNKPVDKLQALINIVGLQGFGILIIDACVKDMVFAMSIVNAVQRYKDTIYEFLMAGIADPGPNSLKKGVLDFFEWARGQNMIY